MIDVSYHDSIKDVQAKFAPSEVLNAAANAPFGRTQWLDLLEQTGLTPFYAGAKHGGAQQGEAWAMLALMHSGGRITPLRNWYNFTWSPLTSGCASAGEMLGAIAIDLKSRAHRITFEPVPNEDGSADQIATAFGEAGWRIEVSQCDINHVIHLRGRSFAQYWQERPGPLRSTLKRKGKKVTARVLDNFDPESWEHYQRIYEMSWKPCEDHPGMLTAFAKQEAAAGRLRLGLAFREDVPVAAQFWTVENGTAYIHKLAHLEEHKSLSAGTTLSAALFEHVIDKDKVAQIDFGTGDQAYKSDWMGDIRPRYRIDCLNMKSPLAWLDLAKLAYHRLSEPDVPMLAQRPASG